MTSLIRFSNDYLRIKVNIEKLTEMNMLSDFYQNDNIFVDF